MNDLRRFEFFTKDHRDPYIQRLIEYNISEIDGFIHFDGYYYVLNEEFPQRVFFNTRVREEKPYEEETTEEGYRAKYKLVEDLFYEIEIYDRIKIENTSSYDEVEEEDGSKMRICYFPTYEQKIFFKVINKFDDFEGFLKRTSEYFTEKHPESLDSN